MSPSQSQITNLRPRLIAHRGASAERPENTLAAFRRALVLRADGIELDVQIARDGVPVVFHDDDLRRLTGRRGRLAEKTWPELRRWRVRGREPVPRLIDVLRLIRRRVVVQIELKAGCAVAPVVAAVRAARAENAVILASFDPVLVAEARRLAPKIPRMLIAERHRRRAWLTRQLTAPDAAGVSVDHRAIRTPAFVRHFHGRDRTVWCWTVNDPRRMRQLADFGVDAILSDDPALLRRILAPESIRSHRSSS